MNDEEDRYIFGPYFKLLKMKYRMPELIYVSVFNSKLNIKFKYKIESGKSGIFYYFIFLYATVNNIKLKFLDNEAYCFCFFENDTEYYNVLNKTLYSKLRKTEYSDKAKSLYNDYFNECNGILIIQNQDKLIYNMILEIDYFTFNFINYIIYVMKLNNKMIYLQENIRIIDFRKSTKEENYRLISHNTSKRICI